MALQAATRTGSISLAFDDLLQSGDAYSAEENTEAGLWCGYSWRLFPSWCSPID